MLRLRTGLRQTPNVGGYVSCFPLKRGFVFLVTTVLESPGMSRLDTRALVPSPLSSLADCDVSIQRNIFKAFNNNHPELIEDHVAWRSIQRSICFYLLFSIHMLSIPK